MRRIGKPAAALGISAVLLAGCGRTGISGDVREPALAVTKDGEVTACMVGEFDRDYYDLDELAQMARAEVADFVGSSGEQAPVRVESVEASEDPEDGAGRVVVTYHFDSPEIYEKFTGETLFYGTVAQAAARGYSCFTVKSVKGGEILTAAEMLLEEKRHVIITETAADIYCPGKVEYLGDGAVLNEDGSVDTSEAGGTVCILLKK